MRLPIAEGRIIRIKEFQALLQSSKILGMGPPPLYITPIPRRFRHSTAL